MNENTVVNEKKPILTVKNIMRALALLCIVFVFCPSFLVSCSGQDMNVNVMTAVGGVSMYGETVVKPHIIMLLCLLIPIAVLVLLFIKKFADKQTAGIILGCTAVDFIIWLIFRASVKKVAEENYCSFKTTGWYVINIIVMLLIIIFSLLVVIEKMKLDTDLAAAFAGKDVQETLNQMSATVSQMSSTVTKMAGNAVANVNNKVAKENAIGFCAKCGAPIAYGCKFCTSCGTPVPESMLAEAEAARKAAEEAARQAAEAEAARRAAEEAARQAAEAEKARYAAEEAARWAAGNNVQNIAGNKTVFCQNCGTPLDANAAFCDKCGCKVKAD